MSKVGGSNGQLLRSLSGTGTRFGQSKRELDEILGQSSEENAEERLMENGQRL
jgi:hypothetical protein